MRLFADLGLNFRHLLHLAHRSTHLGASGTETQQVTARVSNRPFLQGLGTRNLVVGHLAAAALKLQRREPHLCRPVACGQTLNLAHDGRQFELTDGRRALLACGQFRAIA